MKADKNLSQSNRTPDVTADSLSDKNVTTHKRKKTVDDNSNKSKGGKLEVQHPSALMRDNNINKPAEVVSKDSHIEAASQPKTTSDLGNEPKLNLLSKKSPPLVLTDRKIKRYDLNKAEHIDRFEKHQQKEHPEYRYNRNFNKLNHKLSIEEIFVIGSFGIVANEDIKADLGVILALYAGERSKSDEDEDEFSHYVFGFDEKISEETIDGFKNGDFTAFINHSQESNVDASEEIIDGVPHICFRVTKDIKKGEQLVFNYGRKFYNQSILGIKPFFLHPSDTSVSPILAYSIQKKYHKTYASGMYGFDEKTRSDLKLVGETFLIPTIFKDIHNTDLDRGYESLYKKFETNNDYPVDLLAYASDETTILPPSKQQHLTPLMYAAYLGREACVSFLLDQGADANRGMLVEGYTPFVLLLIGKEQNLALVEKIGLELLAYMTHHFVTDTNDLNLLHYAITRNSVALVKALIKLTDENCQESWYSAMYDRKTNAVPHADLDYCLRHNQLEIAEIICKDMLNKNVLVELFMKGLIFRNETLNMMEKSDYDRFVKIINDAAELDIQMKLDKYILKPVPSLNQDINTSLTIPTNECLPLTADAFEQALRHDNNNEYSIPDEPEQNPGNNEKSHLNLNTTNNNINEDSAMQERTDFMKIYELKCQGDYAQAYMLAFQELSEFDPQKHPSDIQRRQAIMLECRIATHTISLDEAMAQFSYLTEKDDESDSSVTLDLKKALGDINNQIKSQSDYQRKYLENLQKVTSNKPSKDKETLKKMLGLNNPDDVIAALENATTICEKIEEIDALTQKTRNLRKPSRSEISKIKEELSNILADKRVKSSKTLKRKKVMEDSDFENENSELQKKKKTSKVKRKHNNDSMESIDSSRKPKKLANTKEASNIRIEAAEQSVIQLILLARSLIDEASSDIKLFKVESALSLLNKSYVNCIDALGCENYTLTPDDDKEILENLESINTYSSAIMNMADWEVAQSAAKLFVKSYIKLADCFGEQASSYDDSRKSISKLKYAISFYKSALLNEVCTPPQSLECYQGIILCYEDMIEKTDSDSQKKEYAQEIIKIITNKMQSVISNGIFDAFDSQASLFNAYRLLGKDKDAFDVAMKIIEDNLFGQIEEFHEQYKDSNDKTINKTIHNKNYDKNYIQKYREDYEAIVKFYTENIEQYALSSEGRSEDREGVEHISNIDTNEANLKEDEASTDEQSDFTVSKHPSTSTVPNLNLAQNSSILFSRKSTDSVSLVSDAKSLFIEAVNTSTNHMKDIQGKEEVFGLVLAKIAQIHHEALYRRLIKDDTNHTLAKLTQALYEKALALDPNNKRVKYNLRDFQHSFTDALTADHSPENGDIRINGYQIFCKESNSVNLFKVAIDKHISRLKDQRFDVNSLLLEVINKMPEMLSEADTYYYTGLDVVIDAFSKIKNNAISKRLFM